MSTQKTSVQRQIRGRLYDLIADLERNPPTKENAVQLRAALTKVKSNKLVRVLRNRDSELSRAIPEDLLAQSDNGKAYLEILEMVRANSAPKQPINSLQGLVENIVQELDQSEIDPSNLDNLLGKITASMEQKQSAGLLNQEALSNDAQQFLEQFQNSAMFQQIMAMPELQTMMQNLPMQTALNLPMDSGAPVEASAPSDTPEFTSKSTE